MKANKISRWLMLIMTVVAVSACDITLYPEDTITPGSYFRNETDLQLFTNNFYTNLPGESIYQDEADIIINPMLHEAVSGQRIIPATSSSNTSGWGWGLLRQVNYFLENSHRCPDEEVRKHYDGIARFFRAYFYYCKVRMYGDVPWYDMVIGSATMLKGSDDTPEQLIAKVASKGGTTERALLSLQADGFNRTIADAMKACTARADELGKQ
jgi:hypothetical protein